MCEPSIVQHVVTWTYSFNIRFWSISELFSWQKSDSKRNRMSTM